MILSRDTYPTTSRLPVRPPHRSSARRVTFPSSAPWPPHRPAARRIHLESGHPPQASTRRSTPAASGLCRLSGKAEGSDGHQVDLDEEDDLEEFRLSMSHRPAENLDTEGLEQAFWLLQKMDWKTARGLERMSKARPGVGVSWANGSGTIGEALAGRLGLRQRTSNSSSRASGHW